MSCIQCYNLLVYFLKIRCCINEKGGAKLFCIHTGRFEFTIPARLVWHLWHGLSGNQTSDMICIKLNHWLLASLWLNLHTYSIGVYHCHNQSISVTVSFQLSVAWRENSGLTRKISSAHSRNDYLSWFLFLLFCVVLVLSRDRNSPPTYHSIHT